METLEFEEKDGVGIITLSRPKALNALNSLLLNELAAVLSELMNSDLRALVLTGSGDRAFAAGADISEMCKREFHTVYKDVSSTGMIVQYTPSAPHLCVTLE